MTEQLKTKYQDLMLEFANEKMQAVLLIQNTQELHFSSNCTPASIAQMIADFIDHNEDVQAEFINLLQIREEIESEKAKRNFQELVDEKMNESTLKIEK